MRRRPQYLDDLDTVQDAIEAAGDDGTTMKEIAEKTRLSYGEVQQATVRLRGKGRVRFEHQGRTIRFWRNH